MTTTHNLPFFTFIISASKRQTFYHRNPSSRHDIFGSTFEREIENKSHKTITRVSQEPDSLNIPKLGDLALNNNGKPVNQ
jgi:hypothetical protein